MTKAQKLAKEKNFGTNEKLAELKTKWSNHIAWGKLYGCLSSDQRVLQLAWKDAQIILFMTTVVNGRNTISRPRERPNTKNKSIIETFGDQPCKRLEIPEFIDMYNQWNERASSFRRAQCCEKMRALEGWWASKLLMPEELMGCQLRRENIY